MITFPESHVDLLGNTPFTADQVAKRWERELLRKWNKKTQDNLRDFMQIRASVNSETFPNYAQNVALMTEFITDKQTLYAKRMADQAKAGLLDQVLAYEQAQRDVAALTLRINGRDAVSEVPEIIDEETLEVTQVFVPAVEAVEPMLAVVTIDGEEFPAPTYTKLVGELDEAQAVINNISEDVLATVALRQAR